MTEGIERGEGSEETGHQLNKDTNYVLMSTNYAPKLQPI